MSGTDQTDTEEQRAFRAHCRKFLTTGVPKLPDFRLPISALEVTTDEQLDWLRKWQRRCYEEGLVGADYPKAYGGGGNKGLQRIAGQEFARANVPPLVNIIGLNMSAPTILHHGTEEQKTRFIPGCLSADEIWCQGFSEPGAGSDLASARASAVLDADKNWIVNGHKVWTTLGKYADHMILLARTSTDEKHKGLTYFLAPIKGNAGVTVRPLVKMTGELGFNEVLFDDAKVADSLRLDEVGAGWKVAMTTLLHERGAAESASAGWNIGDQIERLVKLASRTIRNGRPAIEDPVVRDSIAKLATEAEGIRQNMRRVRVPALNENPMRIALAMKVTVSEWAQNVAHLGTEIEGLGSSHYLGDANAPDGAFWTLQYMSSFGMTIAAGTSEIQRNLLGEQILGLPKTK